MQNKHYSNALERISLVRSRMLLRNPYFGVLSMRLKDIESQHSVKMWTDGVYLGCNPAWVLQAQGTELRTTVAHNVLHNALIHFSAHRRGNRDKLKWHIACDGLVNTILQEAGFRIPDDVICDQRFLGHDVEAVYDMLDDDDMEAGQRSIEEFGDLREAGEGAAEQGESPEPPEVTENKWEQASAAAAQSGLLQGDLPQELLRLIDKITHPEVSITKYLRDFVDRTARNDYNWSVPNRRYVTYGAILPSLISDELPEFVMVFDTSGSIDDSHIELMAGHLDDVLRTYNTAVTVLYVDTKVHRVERFVSGDIIDLRPQGGGGTDFRPAFQWVEDHGMRPPCLLYMSDLCGRFPEQEPEYPVLWCLVGWADKGVKAPFGVTVHATTWA